jgi:predicted PurR-regulated permease PerM
MGYFEVLIDPSMKRKRLCLAAAAVIVVATLAVLYFLGTVLLTLGISAVIAYVLLPVAKLLERGMPWRHNRPSLARGIAVGIIFLAGLGIFAGLVIAVVPPTIEQSQRFIEGFPDFINKARLTIEEWVAHYADLVPADLRDQAEEGLAGAGSIIGAAAWNVAKQTLGIITGSFSFILGLAMAPVLVFYLMKDSGPIRESLHAPFPQAVRPILRDILDISDRTLGGYIRGQLTLGVIVGVIVAVGLLLLDVPFAVILGIVAGLTELVPIIGPWIGGAVGVLVTLATEPDKVLWVILLYLIVQLLENTLLVPRIQADTLNMHPIAVILTITIGSQYFGLWGVILGPPLVALAKDVIIYLVKEWNKAPVVEESASLPDEGKIVQEAGTAAEEGEGG